MDQDHTTGQAEGTPVVLPVIELGNSVGYTFGMPVDIVKEIIDRQIEQMRLTLSYLTDVTVIEDFHQVQAPQVDIFDRWGTTGYYGRFTSMGYERLKTHFSCTKPHMPDVITMAFIQDIIELYKEQQNNKEGEDY